MEQTRTNIKNNNNHDEWHDESSQQRGYDGNEIKIK